jgi:IS1 family transposase
MNVLPQDKQAQITAVLVEGCSIRAVERLTGVHRDTIMRLGVKIGEGCLHLHSALMRDLQVNRIELDEIWAYVGKKQKLVTPDDSDMVGDQYTFIALAGAAKAIITYRTGKRTSKNTEAFLQDLRARVVGSPEISADGFNPYANRVTRGEEVKRTYRFKLKPTGPSIVKGVDGPLPSEMCRECPIRGSAGCRDLRPMRGRERPCNLAFDQR